MKNNKTIFLFLILTFGLLIFFTIKAKKESNFVKIETISPGKTNSPQIQNGNMITIRYTNYLEDGTRLDSNEDRKTSPFKFKLGESQILKGWEEGLIGAKIGERRKVTTDYHLAYGEKGAPPIIPPKANIITEFEIINIE